MFNTQCILVLAILLLVARCVRSCNIASIVNFDVPLFMALFPHIHCDQTSKKPNTDLDARKYHSPLIDLGFTNSLTNPGAVGPSGLSWNKGEEQTVKGNLFECQTIIASCHFLPTR